MPGLYADENFPLPVVDELRRLGFDVVTMYEDDKANRSLTDIYASRTLGVREVAGSNPVVPTNLGLPTIE